MLYLHVLFYNFGLFQLQLIRVIWFSYFGNCIICPSAANGSYKASKSNKRIPKAVSSNGHDGTTLSFLEYFYF